MLIVALVIAAVILPPVAAVATGHPRWAARPMRRALSRGAERGVVATGRGMKAAGRQARHAGGVTRAGIGRGARGAGHASRIGSSRALWAVADHLSARANRPAPSKIHPDKVPGWANRLRARAARWRKAGDVVSRATRVTCACGHVSVDTPWRSNSGIHNRLCQYRRGGSVADRLDKHRRAGTGAPPARGPRSPATTNPGHRPTTGGGTTMSDNVPYLGRLAVAVRDIANLELPDNSETFGGQVAAVAQIHLLLAESLMGWVEALAARRDPKTGQPAPIDPRVTLPLTNAAGAAADGAKTVLRAVELMHQVYAQQFDSAAQHQAGRTPEETWFRP